MPKLSFEGAPFQFHFFHPSEQRGTEREFAVIDRRHSNAARAYTLEQAALEAIGEWEKDETKPSPREALLQAVRSLEMGNSETGKDRIERYEKVMDRYVDEVSNARTADDLFCEAIPGYNEQNKASQLGQFLFSEIVGSHKRNGLVSAERSQAFFLMRFQNKKDYTQFGNSLDSGKLRDDPTSGFFSASVAVGGVTVHIIAINEQRIRQDEAQTIVHERQHFINNILFDSFEHFEQDTPDAAYPLLSQAQGEKKVSLRATKDEVLARLREGCGADDFVPMLKDKSYAQCKKGLSKKEVAELGTLLSAFADVLGHYSLTFKSEEARGVLVNHLIDVPLIRFPTWLRAIGQYYDTRSKQMGAELSSEEFDYMRSLVPSGKSESLYAQVWQQKMQSLVFGGLKRIFTDPRPSQVFFYDFKTQLDPLKRQGDAIFVSGEDKK